MSEATGWLSPVAETVLAYVLLGLFALTVTLLVAFPRIVAIVRRDVTAFFVSPVAYVTLLFYALFGGNSFVGSLSEMVREDEPSLDRAFLGILSANLLVTPVLTMRLFAEERASGTLETLLTTATRAWEVVVAKYLAAMILYTSFLALTVFYYLAVVRCAGADIDHGTVLAGYLGMLLFGSGLVSIGLMVSAFSRSSMVAVVVTLGLFFTLLFFDTISPRLQQLVATVVGAVAPGAEMVEQATEWVRQGMEFVSLSQHIGASLQGRLEGGDVAYHASVTAFCLIMVGIAITQRRA